MKGEAQKLARKPRPFISVTWHLAAATYLLKGEFPLKNQKESLVSESSLKQICAHPRSQQHASQEQTGGSSPTVHSRTVESGDA